MTVGKESRALVNEILRPHTARPAVHSPELANTASVEAEFAVTNQTEVLLNGKPCKYAQVPTRASIVYMELAADKKTVLRIHFQTKK
jgi:hypothetical protein